MFEMLALMLRGTMSSLNSKLKKSITLEGTKNDIR